jgi:CDP-glycerol glycerophosphotransferase (TagB/SpsB family)
MLDNPSAENYNEILGGNLPINSNKFFAWGNISAKCALQSTHYNDKIETVGSPNIDRVFLQKKNAVKNSNAVLLLATGPRDQQSMGHNVNEWNKYENLIKKISSVVAKHNLDLIIKRHPDMAESNFSKNFSQEFPNVKILKHAEILDLLLLSKIVISVGVSSSIFEAQILEKPVISVMVDHDIYGSPKSVSESCIEIKINDFEENFSKLINDSQSYQQIVQNANNELKENFDNIGQSAKKILDSLKNLKDKNS